VGDQEHAREGVGPSGAVAAPAQAWTPAHLGLLREIRDAAQRLAVGAAVRSADRGA
jgi:hypothetical protein